MLHCHVDLDRTTHVSCEALRSPVREMQRLGRIRRRDGAYRWGVFRDTFDPTRYLETFLVESWPEHLRQHERVTMADRAIEDRVCSFNADGAQPAVTHLVLVREDGEQPA